MHRILILVVAAGTLSACAADIHLKNPTTGQTAICKGGYYSHGLIGMANETDKQLQMRCLDDYQKQGYQRAGD